MSALIKLVNGEAVIIDVFADGAVEEAPAAAVPPPTEAQGDARKKIKPNLKQADAPSVMEWEGGAYLRLADWIEHPRPGGAVVLMPGEDPQLLAGHLDGLDHIAIDFPKFTDGRGYSHAVLLRTRLGYLGELRAVGDVLRDQLFYLRRCGFDAFRLKPGKDPEEAIAAFADFSDVYQGAADQRAPLFRRRAHAS